MYPAQPFYLSEDPEPFEFGGTRDSWPVGRDWAVPLYPGMRREVTSLSLTFDRFADFGSSLDVLRFTVYLDNGIPAEVGASVTDLIGDPYSLFEEQLLSLGRELGLTAPL